MSTPGLITALLLPAILGISWLRLLWRDSHLAARIGYGYLLGIFAVTTLLRIWDSMGLSLSLIPISTLIIVLSMIPPVLGYHLKPNPTSQSHYVSFDASWQKVIWGLLLTILVIRYGGILYEIIWRPLYPWDAWMNWAPKAKTWFELKELVPFVNHIDWANESIQSGAYTLGNLRVSTYPPLVPLIHTWTALGMGKWIDNLVNIPWAQCSVALGLAFYGQGRMLGAKPHVSLISVFLILSIPYINVHTALAGYADLWLATFYCLAVMAFINWSLTKSNIQAMLAFIFALACIQTKIPGLIWAATLIPAAILAVLPTQWRYVSLIVVLLGTGAWFYSGGFSINVPFNGTLVVTPELFSLPRIGSFTVEYHQAGRSFISNNLIWGNWHMLGWVVLITLVPVFIRNIAIQPLLAPGILILSGLLFIVITFFFTDHYNSAVDNTTINRATLHILPALLYFLLLSYTHYYNQIKKKAA